MTVAVDVAMLPEAGARLRPLTFAPFIRDWKRGCLW